MKLMNWIFYAAEVLRRSVRWMSWNLFLAFVPVVLSVWLFRRSRSRSPVWWLGFAVFVAFLPNAPYVLTDIIHLVREIRGGASIWVVTLLLVPQYVSFMLAGFQAYVLSLINLGHYLERHRKAQWVLPTELSLHALSAIGIYLGRFKRFNSWDFVTQPDAVFTSMFDSVVNKQPLLIIAITFVVLTGLYWGFKQITLAVLLRDRYTRRMARLPVRATVPQRFERSHL
jgi:uncharacterized membrane protein